MNMFNDLSIAEAADHLGINETTFRRLISNGEGPRARREGRTWRFLPDHLDAWGAEYREKAYASTAKPTAKPAAKAKNGKGSKSDPLA